jgi:hypothetical protein
VAVRSPDTAGQLVFLCIRHVGVKLCSATQERGCVRAVIQITSIDCVLELATPRTDASSKYMLTCLMQHNDGSDWIGMDQEGYSSAKILGDSAVVLPISCSMSRTLRLDLVVSGEGADQSRMVCFPRVLDSRSCKSSHPYICSHVNSLELPPRLALGKSVRMVDIVNSVGHLEAAMV